MDALNTKFEDFNIPFLWPIPYFVANIIFGPFVPKLANHFSLKCRIALMNSLLILILTVIGFISFLMPSK